jgi:hypothetical protein
MRDKKSTIYARTADKGVFQALTPSTGLGPSYGARALPWGSDAQRTAYQENRKKEYVEIRDHLTLFHKKVRARKGLRLKYRLRTLSPEDAKEYESLRRSYLRVFYEAGWSMARNPKKSRRSVRGFCGIQLSTSGRSLI